MLRTVGSFWQAVSCSRLVKSDASGTRHKKLPTSLFLFAQDHPEQVRIIQAPVDGRNALDFMLTLEIGRMIAADPEGYYHIISKDTDFDSVVSHPKGREAPLPLMMPRQPAFKS